MIAALLLAGAAATPAPRPASTLSADSAELRAAERIIVARGRVVAVHGRHTIRCREAVASYEEMEGRRRITRIVGKGGEGETDLVEILEDGAHRAHAREAVFDDALRTITLEGSPSVMEGARTVEGERIVLFVDTDVVEVHKARTHDGSNGAQARIEAGHAVLRDGGASVVLSKGVVVRRGHLVASAPRGHTRASKDRKLERMVLEGGVTAVEGARIATGERAEWNAAARTLVLTGGRPTLAEGGDTVTGERIVFHQGQDRVEVEKATAHIEVRR